MFKSPDMNEIRRLSKPPAAAADKTSPIQTCNRLSQLIKERRFPGYTIKGIPPNLEHKVDKSAKPMNLLSSKESSNDGSKEIAAAMELLPQFLHTTSCSNNESDSRAKDQLTIFYCGKVLVFNDFAAENATEIMEMAAKLSSYNIPTKEKLQPSVPVLPEANYISLPETKNADTEQEGPRPGSQASGSNLKIARRASLHKFFEKRKERVTARGPYSLNNPVTAFKPAGESSSGASDADRDHDQSSKELELKL